MRRITAFVWIAAVGAMVAVALLRRGRATARTARTGDVVPGSAEGRGALVDAAAEDSFPASDPPSYWGRETEG